MRHIRVTKEGLSTKVLAATVVAFVADWLMRYQVELDEKWIEVATVVVATALAGWLVPEKEG